MNTTTKTVRIAVAATIAPLMPDHVLELLEYISGFGSYGE